MVFETFVRGVRKALEAVEGDLLVDNGTVDAPKGGLRVSGLTKCKGDCRFVGDVSTSEMDTNGGEVLVEGSLTADRLVHARGALGVKGDLKADRVDVHKHADIGGGLDAHEVSVGGSLTVEGVTKTNRADVGGSLRCGSDADLGRVDVGGSAEMFGATRSERIDVGGRFTGRGQCRLRRRRRRRLLRGWGGRAG